MAAGKAYQYHHHLGFEEEKVLHAHAQFLLYPSHSHHLIWHQQTATTTRRSYLLKQQQQQHYTRSRQRRHAPNWATGGPGMQTVFLGPSPTSCGSGTGVFLPQRPPPLHFQPITKPPPPPPPDLNRFRDVKGGGGNNKKGQDKDKGHSNFSLQSRRKNNSSGGVFLPKEWTY